MRDFFDIVLPNLLVLLGWGVVYLQTLKIKRREDLQILVEKITSLIEIILKESIEYFESDEIEPIGHESAKIRADSLLLSKYLMILKDRGVCLKSGKALIEFRKHSMGGYFENSRRSEQSNLPNWKSDLANSRTELIYCINRSFLDWCHR